MEEERQRVLAHLNKLTGRSAFEETEAQDNEEELVDNNRDVAGDGIWNIGHGR